MNNNQKQLLNQAKRRRGRPTISFGIERDEKLINKSKNQLTELLNFIDKDVGNIKQLNNAWRTINSIVINSPAYGATAEDFRLLHPEFKVFSQSRVHGDRKTYNLEPKNKKYFEKKFRTQQILTEIKTSELDLEAQKRESKTAKEKLKEERIQKQLDEIKKIELDLEALKRESEIEYPYRDLLIDKILRKDPQRRTDTPNLGIGKLEERFIELYGLSNLQDLREDAEDLEEKRSSKITRVDADEIVRSSKPDIDLDYKHGENLQVETNNKSSSNPEIKDSLIPSNFVGRSDFKSDVPVNETSETNKNNFSTSNTAIPSYALTEEYAERLLPPQLGGQTNTRNNENIYDYTLEVKGGGNGSNARASSLDAPDEGLPNTGNYGLPQSGKGGRYIFADLDELNNNEIDIRGTALSDMWGNREYKEEVKLHNRGGGNIAGGSGDIINDDSKDYSNSDAWGGVFLGHDELEDELDPVLGASSLENAGTLDIVRRMFLGDEQDYENTSESKRNAFNMFTSSIDDDWKKDILDKSIGRMLGDEYGTSAVDRIRQKRRIKESIKTGMKPTKKLPFRLTAPSLKDIPYRPPSSTYRTNNVGMVRESATNHLRSVNELLPRV